jgi:chemotaxis response regulator CheB
MWVPEKQLDGLAHKILNLILKESGFFEVIEQIYDSRQAQIKCFSLKPELVIMDYNMPYINGLEVVRQLNTSEK